MRIRASMVGLVFLGLIAGCSNDPTKRISKLCNESNLVVVGEVVTYQIKLPGKSDVRYHWDAKLSVDDILKGVLSMSHLHILWDELELKTIPEYELGDRGIWFLSESRTSDGAKCFRVDAFLPPDYLPEVKKYFPALDIK